MKYENIYKSTNKGNENLRHKHGKFKGPKREKMLSSSVECWKCGESILAKPFFLKGVKKFKYYDKDGTEHQCL